MSHDFSQNDSKAERKVLEFGLKVKLRAQVGVGGPYGSPVDLTLFAVTMVDVAEHLWGQVAQ